jgi:hypothetical protein
MKKLLFAVPIILLLLCVTPFALLKDQVHFASTGAGLTPGHWRLRAYSIGGSSDLTRNLFLTDNTVGKAVPAISEGAHYYGFPFAFYLTNHGASKASEVDIQALSWLWLAVDMAFILGTLAGAAALNRRRPRQ